MSVFLLADVKELAGGTAVFPDATTDKALQFCLDAAESHIQNLCRLRLAPVTITDWYGGNWQRFLTLRQRPVRSVSEVLVYSGTSEQAAGQGTDADPPDPLVLGEDYYLGPFDWQTFDQTPVQLCMSPVLWRRDSVWPGAVEKRWGRVVYKPVNGQGNVRVTYAAGFPEGRQPAEFLPAVAAATLLIYRQVPAGGLLLTSDHMDGASVALSFLTPAARGQLDMLGEIRSLVARYRRPFIG